jgi:hypothetical protein
MPLTSKGEKVLRAMKKYYKDDEKAESIFYAMKQKGKLSGTEEINNELGKWLPSHERPKSKGKK